MSDELYRMLTGGEKPGFSGKDKMRSTAERMFAEELRGAKTPNRAYKKGGHVNHSKHHGLNHDQTDLHLPHRKSVKHYSAAGPKAVRKSLGGVLGNVFNATPAGMAFNTGRSMLGFKKGGKAHKKHHYAEGGAAMLNPGMRMAERMRGMMPHADETHSMPTFRTAMKKGGKAHKKHHYATGGAVDDMQNMNAMGSNAQSLKVNPALKRGGKVKHHRAKHMAYGGLFGDASNTLNRGIDMAHNYLGQGANAAQGMLTRGMSNIQNGVNQGVGSLRGFLGIKRGGKVAKRHHKSEGGPMRGEHPSHHLVKNNYESDMKGEERVSHSYKHGGRTHKKHHYEGGGMARFECGGSPKMAVGGVAKMRHGVMNKHGEQIRTAHVKRGRS